MLILISRGNTRKKCWNC